MLIRRAGAVAALVLGLAVAVPVLGSVTAQAADPNQPVRLAIAVPITVPASSIGLIDAEALEAYTRPLGVLTRQLDAVFGRQVAIGVDPMIIASIRALGTTAPESAIAVARATRGCPEPDLPARPTPTSTSRSPRRPAPPRCRCPTSFTLDPAIVAPVEPTETPSPEPTDEADDPDAPDVPTVEELLAGSTRTTGSRGRVTARWSAATSRRSR